MKRISLTASFLFFLFAFSFTPPSEALQGEELKGKQCLFIEPEEMKNHYEDDSILLNNMFIFDIRPYSIAMRGKQIPRAMLINYRMFQDQSVHDIQEWKGNNVYLVGEDTESTENFCKFIINKNYDIGNIYVLNGGMKEWTGPVLGDFNKVQCESINLVTLKNMFNTEKNVEVVDLRSSGDYIEGHIPGAISEKEFSRDKFCLSGTVAFVRAIQKNGTVVFVGNSEGEITQRCRSFKWVADYEKMYMLSGNFKDWNGPLEKGALGILKTEGTNNRVEPR